MSGRKILPLWTESAYNRRMRFWVGIFIGLILGGLIVTGGFFWWQYSQKPSISSFRPADAPSSAAGTASNFAANIPANQRVQVSVALTDDVGGALGTNPTDLTSVDITITKAEAVLTQPDLTIPTETLPHTETLDIAQPTIELFSLRGSGSLATIGTTGLASGKYSAIELTIGSAKGRKADGQVVDIRLPNNVVTLIVTRDFSWTGSGDIQVVLDLDSFGSLTQNGADYVFKPVVRQVLQNDEIIPSPNA